MGVDLTLVFDKWQNGGPVLAYNRLGFCGRHYHLWDCLAEAATPAPEGIDWYGDDGVERQTTDLYGDPIRMLTAATFVHVWDCDGSGHWDDWDKAVAAFVKALPPATMLYLWFH